ncbi:hypothetical protein EVA_10931 [gut metagenome]|uniref:Uncharacterized protein n=1 Tax=gut metagenome TaxID=749906 RepID=J9GGL2_9ZZZZ
MLSGKTPNSNNSVSCRFLGDFHPSGVLFYALNFKQGKN